MREQVKVKLLLRIPCFQLIEKSKRRNVEMWEVLNLLILSIQMQYESSQ